MAKLLSASIGERPSLRDVLRMARPTPKDDERRALFGWLTDKVEDKWAPATATNLPGQVLALQAFRAAADEATQLLVMGELEGVRWDMLASMSNCMCPQELGDLFLTGIAGCSAEHQVNQGLVGGFNRVSIDFQKDKRRFQSDSFVAV